MTDLIESMRSLPWFWAWIAFFLVAFLLAGGTYVIGRAVAAGALRGREPGERTREAMRQVERWGPPAVTLSFLTVGVQTVVNLAAGLCRMSVPRYLTGLVPGAMIWGTIWATIGMTAFYAIFTGGAERIAWLLALVVAVVLLALVTRSVRQPH